MWALVTHGLGWQPEMQHASLFFHERKDRSGAAGSPVEWATEATEPREGFHDRLFVLCTCGESLMKYTVA